MKTALYCYWGAVGDHNLNIPGHPFYQLYNLEFLAKKFSLDKIYFFSFLSNKVEKNASDANFFIQESDRSEILKNLQLEIVSFGEAIRLVNTVDMTFLKARFRNKSRAQERSFDALKFEELLRRSPNDRTYVIDSDGELPTSFFEANPAHLLTFFLDHSFYDKYTALPLSVSTIAPALVSRIQEHTSAPSGKDLDVMFIGNEGLKQPKLASWLSELVHDGVTVCAHGKWKSSHPFQILPRTARDIAYAQFLKSRSTLQVSKPKYCEFTFLSPRVYESALANVVAFIEQGYTAMTTEFTEVSSYFDFREKVLCLREGYERDFHLVLNDQLEELGRIERSLLSKGPQALHR